MRKCLLILVTCSAGAVGWAQTAPLSEPVNHGEREQRRAELRTVLQAHRQWEPTATAAEASSFERQLTELERAEIRQQLRQSRPERPKSRP